VYILRESSKDWFIVALVAVLAVGANAPEAWTRYFAIDQRYLLAGLIGIVGVALVRYLKFTLVLVVAILAIGANLPEQLAAKFGVDTNILLLALAGMIVMSLANRLLRLPSGAEKKQGAKSVHGAASLFNAIVNGRVATVEALIATGANVNVRTVNGTTPLMVAASKGYSDIVKILLDHGANHEVRKSDGTTALSIAEKAGFTRTAELLQRATYLRNVTAAAAKNGQGMASTAH
jgi:hypothetical protein